MPTAYTDKIYNGIEFEDFVLNCSRNFGALIHMRDNGLDAEITMPETSDYHVKGLNKARAELKNVTQMSLDKAELNAKEDFDKTVEYRASRDKSNAKKQLQLNAMLAKVSAWSPPTSDHVGLKAFMIKQIEETLKFDCGTWPEEPVTLQTPPEWIKARLDSMRSDIDYHMKHLEEDRERNTNRQQWIIKLFESLGRGEDAKTLKKVKF